MSAKHKLIFKNETLLLTFHEIEKYWLYDYTRGMNLAMRAENEQKAFIVALNYYQKRLSETENELKSIKEKFYKFIEKFEVDED